MKGEENIVQFEFLARKHQLGRLRITILVASIFHFCTLSSHAQQPEDFVGHWSGRFTGNGVNVVVYFDRWLEDGKLKGVTTIVPFFVAREEITFNSDGTIWSSTPSTLGIIEGTVTLSLPTKSEPAKISRVSWSQSEGNLSGAGEFNWVAPDSSTMVPDSKFAGRYEGVLWPGLAVTERIDVLLDIRIQKGLVTGKINLPVEEVQIVKGYRFGNRLVLDIAGKTLRGIWVGTITPKGLQFHWDMGVGYGQAELTKAGSEPESLE